MKRIIITESQLKELAQKTSDGGTILYRVNRDTLENDFKNPNVTYGLFFTDDLDYYDSKDQITGYKRQNAEKYVLSPNAKIWNPIDELNLSVNSYDYIDGKMVDFEKYGIEDECTWEYPEDRGVTSTDGLAIAGKKLGYDGTLVKGTAYVGGDYANEYIIYNSQVIKKI